MAVDGRDILKPMDVRRSGAALETACAAYTLAVIAAVGSPGCGDNTGSGTDTGDDTDVGTSMAGTTGAGSGAGSGGATSTGTGMGAGTGTGTATSTSGGSTGGVGGCTGGKVVHFVYFVEADQLFTESQSQDIHDQALAFQQYWYEQLGVTFFLNEPVVDVVMADHDSAWYIETPDGIHGDDRWYRLGNIKTEVYNKLGIQDFDPQHRVVNYPIVRSDGRVGANFGGAWMDGDDMTCMSGATGTYPYDDNNPAHCLGHAAHEFGHILGLDHEGPDTDCMQFGFYNGTGGSGMCDFSPDNVAKILADPDNAGWFGAVPGDTCDAGGG
jgi:hypothetical protein